MTKITSWLFAGWYPQSRGVKKPYNAVLGEYFRCFWEHPEDHSRTWYLAEQVSHHPPITAFRFENRQQGWYVDAHIFTKTKFLGNSVVCYLLGDIHLKVLRKKLPKAQENTESAAKEEAASSSSSATPNVESSKFSAPASMDDDEYEIEDYNISLPGVYGRGIIIGTLAVEICDKLICTCLQTNLRTELDFKAKVIISFLFIFFIYFSLLLLLLLFYSIPLLSFPRLSLAHTTRFLENYMSLLTKDSRKIKRLVTSKQESLVKAPPMLHSRVIGLPNLHAKTSVRHPNLEFDHLIIP